MPVVSQLNDGESAARMHQDVVAPGFVDQADFLDAIAADMGMEKVMLSEVVFTPELIKEVPANIAKKYGVIPVRSTPTEIWLALSDRVILHNGPMGWRVASGLLGGFVGAAVLIGSNALAGHAPLGGMLVAVAATICWTIGSLYARRAPLPKAPLLGSGMQQIVGGTVILAVAGAVGQVTAFDVSAVSTASWAGLVWLIIAGSFVGFSCYLWLLRNVRTSLVATYAYVNPLVAVTLGTLVLHEPFTARLLVSGAIVLGSVALIVSAGGVAHEETAPATDGTALEEPEIVA
jgi:hypothetical protein